ncbi:MAG: hypothetical protein U1C96_06100 [Gallionella sp.]|nr:hypothetical protein [Gallionella sp.]
MHADPAGLWQALVIFLALGALLGIALGLLLIIRPQWVTALNHVANRWISTRNMNRFLDRSISIEQYFYRHHRVLGVLAVAGAIYVLMHFGLQFDKQPALRGMIGYLPPHAADSLLDALVLASLTGGAFALWAGLLLGLRPSMLRGLEEGANQWITARRLTRQIDIPRDDVDRLVLAHAPQSGWLLLLGGLALLILLLRLFLH